MSGPLRMTIDEMREGLKAGRTLTQEEWAHPQEIEWVETLIAEGTAQATPWEYRDGFQCERRKVSRATPKEV
jgi:hypothetical protein